MSGTASDEPDRAPESEADYYLKSIISPDEPDRAPDGEQNYHLKSIISPDEPDARDPLEEDVHAHADAPNVEEGKPNGVDAFPASIEEAAKELAAKNPSWSLKRIARELGQPERRIAQYLPDHTPPKRNSRTNRASTDSEIERVIAILRALGTDGATANSLYDGHHVYLGTLKEAKARGLLQESGGWSLA